LADDEPKLRRITALLRGLGPRFGHLATARPLEALPACPPLAGRKLRVGFLSSDLRTHSVAKFVLPVFRHFDRERFEMFCYSGYPEIADSVQTEIRGLVNEFRFINELNDREAAQLIRADGVDVLFDLGGYTAHSRVPVIAYRAAPIQASWLGWPATTGMPQMDYFIVDRHTRPTCDDFLIEKPLELSGAFCCFESFVEEPVVAPPFETNGYVTFGTLNGAYKYTRPMIARWAEVMLAVPGSRMVIVRPEARSLIFLDNIAREFEKNGVTRDRLDIIDNRQGAARHLSYYNLFDLSLDTFPVTGGTTTTDALWMGVPVVSLMGQAYHQRIGGGIAKHCGLDDLCVETGEAFVRVAVALANDHERLAGLRRSLRPTLLDSPLCRVDKFMAGFEGALLEVAKKHLG
jgi:predicted O-linked N-acetylglucosamine transferase (SPINDLY family)